MIGGLAFAAFAAAAPAGTFHPVAVPTIACPSDGQQGPRPPARRRLTAPRLPSAAAARLALYVSGELSVLAPRGWNCLELTGSDGTLLIVTPERRSFEDIHDLRGPAVQLSLSFGGTSGRFAVAEAIARLFPHHMEFARRVEAEGMFDQPLPSGPFPADRLERVSANIVRFTTPPGAAGLGTVSRLVPDAEPIEGTVILLGNGEEMPDLLQLSVRLPANDPGLASLIIDQVGRNAETGVRSHR